MKIKISKPLLPKKEKYFEKIKIIWENNHLTNSGPLYQEFLFKLKKEFLVENIHLVNNGHNGLELIFKHLNFKGGEIITTSFTFISTIQAIINSNLKPVFCDINLNTFNIDEKLIENLITNKTKAILATHVFGNPCNISEIAKIAKKYNLIVIYDAAHCFGINFKNKALFAYGDFSIVSFHATKIFNSVEGGIIYSSDKSLLSKFNSLSNFGIIEDYPGYLEYGTNAKISEFHCAMGILNLELYKQEINYRKKLYELYKENLSEIKGIFFQDISTEINYNYSYFPIVIDELLFKKNRDLVFLNLEKNKIIAKKYFYPIVTNISQNVNLEIIPNAIKLSNEILLLPIHSGMSLNDINLICNIIKNS